MQIAIPQEITDSNLSNSNVPLDEAPLWAAGTYNQGDEVIYENQVWIAATTTTDDPVTGASKSVPTWVRRGWTNRWRMFNDGVDSKTTNTGSITGDLSQTTTNTVAALLGLNASSATLTMTDPVEGVVYTKTVDLVDIGVTNWWQWHFLGYDTIEDVIFNLPPYPNATISFSVDGFEPTDEVECGRLVLGLLKELGVTLQGTSVSNLSYSSKERDDFGNLILNKRRTVKLVDYQVLVDTIRVSSVRNSLDRIDNTPTLFIGTDEQGFGATIVFGVTQDFRLIYSGPHASDMTLTVEGF